MARIKKTLVFTLIITLTLAFQFPTMAFASPDLAPQSKSAILIDAQSGQTIFQKNSEEKLAPASVTKIMTLLLVMEALKDGKISLEEQLTTSHAASKMGGSQIWLEPGEKMTVEELIIAVAVASANDASYVLAEHIGGSYENFINMMNEKAGALKMENTHFVNSCGLDAEGHYTSAKDISIMSRELIKHEEIFKWTSMYEYYLRNGDSWLVNTNRLVRFYDGCDGLKTGSTSTAGFCLSATAKKDDMRLIAVTMKAPSSAIRNAEITSMLNYGFSNFTSYKIVDKNVAVESIGVKKGMVDEIDLKTATKLQVVLPKNSEDQITTRIEIPDSITAPINEGDTIGRLIAEKDGLELASVELLASETVKQARFISILKEILRSTFS